MKTALVLSAGGMFGAYQAGAWKALARWFQPDMVVGASIGSLNGWAIAAGCPPERLIEIWLGLDPLSNLRWRLPSSVVHGFIDSEPIERIVENLYRQFEPKLPYGVVITDTLRLRPELVRTPNVTWQHLAASSAMLGFFSQQRIKGRLYSDGGLLGAVPLWAAKEMGAERAIVVNVLPELPGWWVRASVRTVTWMAPFKPEVPDGMEVLEITAPPNLGSPRDALYWSRDNIARWIAQGEKDAEAVLERV